MYIDIRPNYNYTLQFETYPGEVVFHVERESELSVTFRGVNVKIEAFGSCKNRYFSLDLSAVPDADWESVNEFVIIDRFGLVLRAQAQTMKTPEGYWVFVKLGSTWVSLFPVAWSTLWGQGHSRVMNRFEHMDL